VRQINGRREVREQVFHAASPPPGRKASGFPYAI
jgi:hypothetical protein